MYSAVNKNKNFMKTIKHVDENTFEEIEHQFDDFHYELANNIKSDVHDRYQVGWKIAETTEILSNKNGDKLILGVIENRKKGKLIANKYKITIEKI